MKVSGFIKIPRNGSDVPRPTLVGLGCDNFAVVTRERLTGTRPHMIKIHVVPRVERDRVERRGELPGTQGRPIIGIYRLDARERPPN